MSSTVPRPASVADAMTAGLVPSHVPLDAAAALLAFARRYDLALAPNNTEVELVAHQQDGVRIYRPMVTPFGLLAWARRSARYLPGDVVVSGYGLEMRCRASCRTRLTAQERSWVGVDLDVAFGECCVRGPDGLPLPGGWRDCPDAMLALTAEVWCAQKALGEPWSTVPVLGIGLILPPPDMRGCIRDIRVTDRRFRRVLN